MESARSNPIRRIGLSDRGKPKSRDRIVELCNDSMSAVWNTEPACLLDKFG